MTALARMGQQGPFYIFAAFVFTYGTTVLHSSRNLLLAAVMCSAAMIAQLDVGVSSEDTPPPGTRQ